MYIFVQCTPQREKSLFRFGETERKLAKLSITTNCLPSFLIIIFWVQRSSAGCIVAQKGPQQLSRNQHSSVGCNEAQYGAAKLCIVQRSSIGYILALTVPYRVAKKGAAQLSIMQCSSQGTPKLRRVQHSSPGCSLAQYGTAQFRGCRVECSIAQQKAKT